MTHSPNLAKQKTIMIYSPCKFIGETWLPVLWSQAKTYYEKHGRRRGEWSWYPCYADIWCDNTERVKEIIEQARPDVFAISLYVWSARTAFEIAKWVKHRFPKCLIISGGPHQDFQHDPSWFQRHTYIDCSLPGDRYGELCFTELLDNISDRIDFNLVSDVRYPVGKGRIMVQSKKSMVDRRDFDYEWCSYAEQKANIIDYLEYAKLNLEKVKAMSIIETTRGCPYGCTYCDWGGGINTRVIKKSLCYVEKDLDFLSSLDLKYVFVADANFGIFGDRDVEVAKKLVHYRNKHNSFFRVGYGGFAKTDNRIEFIAEIIRLDLENNLSLHNEIKLSMQSLDEEVLKNIDRKNITLDLQLKYFASIAEENRIALYVEMILGLPGMDLDKFYRELTELGRRGLAVQWFEWILLPETPAYDPQYRKKFGLGTVKKTQGWAYHEPSAEREIVVGGKYFDNDDYLEMMIAAGCYNALIQGGLYRSSVAYIKRDIGDLVRDIVAWYQRLYPELKQQWKRILQDPSLTCRVHVSEQEVYLLFHFVAQCYINSDDFMDRLGDFLSDQGVPKYVIWWDKICHIDHRRYGVKIDKIIEQFGNFQRTGKILRKLPLTSRKKLL